MNKFTAQGRIKEVDGSVFTPINAGLKMVMLVHSENGAYESELYNTFVKRFPKIKDDYRSAYVNQRLKMGDVNTTVLNSELWAIQVCCLNKKNKLDKAALEKCLQKVVETAKYEKATIHISDALYTDVPSLKKLLGPVLTEAGVSLYVYKEPKISQ